MYFVGLQFNDKYKVCPSQLVCTFGYQTPQGIADDVYNPVVKIGESYFLF